MRADATVFVAPAGSHGLAAPLSSAELNARNLQNVIASLTDYLHGGGPLSIETRHGEAAHENEIVFRVADWNAFVAALEPPAGRSPVQQPANGYVPGATVRLGASG